MQSIAAPERTRLTSAAYYQTSEYQAHTLIQLIDGEIVIGMAPIPQHQEIVGNTHVFLWLYAKIQGGRVYIAPIEVELDEGNVYEPDVVYLAPQTSCRVEEKRLMGAPDLVVEVLSPSTAKYDRQHKFETYQARGVREYWIIDPAHQTLEAWASEEGRFVKRGTFAPGEVYTCATLNQTPIALNDLFGSAG